MALRFVQVFHTRRGYVLKKHDKPASGGKKKFRHTKNVII